jgi:hypothetical protein
MNASVVGQNICYKRTMCYLFSYDRTMGGDCQAGSLIWLCCPGFPMGHFARLVKLKGTVFVMDRGHG